MSVHDRLEDAKRKREAALAAARHADASLETLGRASGRLRTIVARLAEGDPSEGEKELLDVLRRDLAELAARRDATRKRRDDATSRARKLAQRIAELRDRLRPGKYAMEDSTTVSAISRTVKAAAGYVDGIFANFDEIKAGPWPITTSICIRSTSIAEAGDCEPGCMSNVELVGWAKRQIAAGKKPRVYTFLSNAQPVVDALAAGGVPRDKFKLWTAHDTGRAHICSPTCGFGLKSTADATQWGLDGNGTGRHVDISLCRGTFDRP